MKQFASPKIGFGGFLRYQPIGPLKGGAPVSPNQKYFLYFGLYFPYYYDSLFFLHTAS